MKNETKIGIVFIISIIFFFCIPLAIQSETIDSPHLNWFIDRCAIHEVNLEVVLAVAIVESNIEMVISRLNSNGSLDIGTFQINNYYLNYFAETFWYKDRVFDVNNVEDNIEMGILILKNLYQQTGSWENAVRAYNQGCEGLKQNPNASNSYFVKIVNVLSNLTIKDNLIIF